MHLRELRLSIHSRYLLSPALLSTRRIAPSARSTPSSTTRFPVTLLLFVSHQVRWPVETCRRSCHFQPFCPSENSVSRKRCLYLKVPPTSERQRILRWPHVYLCGNGARLPSLKAFVSWTESLVRLLCFFVFFPLLLNGLWLHAACVITHATARRRR